MAFTYMEAERINDLVGGLCKRRAPDDLKDRIRMSYVIGDRGVVIYEHRPRSQGSSDWSEREVAKLTYLRNRHQWQLYSKRAGKWISHEGLSGNLRTLINEMELDTNGYFFGQPRAKP